MAAKKLMRNASPKETHPIMHICERQRDGAVTVIISPKIFGGGEAITIAVDETTSHPVKGTGTATLSPTTDGRYVDEKTLDTFVPSKNWKCMHMTIDTYYNHEERRDVYRRVITCVNDAAEIGFTKYL